MNLQSVSFAVLGQLAFQPRSAYELVKEMKRNFHYFYPKAESGLYNELKKLEKLQLVSSVAKVKGNKGRTVYTINSLGRRRLREWLGTQPDNFWLEFDGLLRVYLSKFGSKAALTQSLDKIRTDTTALLDLATQVGNEYLNNSAPAQREIAERAIIFDFLLHYAIMYRDWLDRTEVYLRKIESLSAEGSVKHSKKSIKLSLQKFNLPIESPQ